jgi:hypothetical protein
MAHNPECGLDCVSAQPRWQWCEPDGEKPCWVRRSDDKDGLHGMDPLTGLMIAYSQKEANEIDARRRCA